MPKRAAVREARARRPWKYRFAEATAALGRRFPDLELDAPFRTAEGWAAAVTVSTHLTGHCRGCDQRVDSSVADVLSHGQGFGCNCAHLATAKVQAVAHLQARYVFVRMEMEPGAGCNRACIHTRCAECGHEGGTAVHSIVQGQQPGCWCNGHAPWAGGQGYGHFCGIVATYGPSRFYEIAFDRDWWLEHVETRNSKVPLRCTACRGDPKYVRINDIQQGGGPGCGCQYHAQENMGCFLQGISTMGRIVPQHPAGRSPKTGAMLTWDFADRIDTPEGYDLFCVLLGLVPGTFVVIIFYLEVDGDQHFTGFYGGHECVDGAYRDHVKECWAVDAAESVIRIPWHSIMRPSPNMRPWKEYLLAAMRCAVQHPGCVLHPDLPCYTTSAESVYVQEHAESTQLSAPLRDESFPEGCVRRALPERNRPDLRAREADLPR